MKSASIPFCCWKTVKLLLKKWYRTNWHICWYGNIYRVAPHGKEWKWMMESVLGVPARRTHQFELQSVRRNTFPYRCKCGSISLPYAAIIA